MSKFYWTSKLILGLETVILIIIPLIAVWRWPEIMAYRHVAILVGLIYFGWFIKTNPGLFKGIFHLNYEISFKVLLVSVLASMGLAVIYPFFKIDKAAGESVFFTSGWTVWEIILSYVLLSVPIQELLFRSIYIERLRKVGLGEVSIILFSALIFGLVHTPFNNRLMPLGTFAGGLWWAHLWLRTKSLWPSILSHSILGSVFIYLAYQA